MGKTYYIIYETRNLKNSKIYIGMHETNNLNDGYLGSGTRIKRAIRYYGKEFFERKILHFCKNREEMINKEIEIVNESFINRNDVYNIMLGGKGGKNSVESNRKNSIKHLGKLNPMYGRPKTLKQLKAASETCKRLHREGIFKPYDWTGRKHTIKTINKIKKSINGKQQGNKNSQYGTCWIRNEELNENKKIPKSDLEEWLSKGWIKGRKMK